MPNKTPSQVNENKIYSKKAIMGFSAIFTPFIGGFLLRQNLLDKKDKKNANIILIVSILFTLITIIIVNMVSRKSSSLTYILNISWGAILSEYFFKKHFPSDNYKYKKIWKPLIISILITIPFILAIFLVAKE